MHQRGRVQSGAGAQRSGALISPAAESELDEIIAFLRQVFQTGADHPMFQPALMRWKCFTPHPFWEGSRGYLLRHKQQIGAFGCLMPIRLLTGTNTVTSCNVIDWAASKTVPGAGLMLYTQIQRLTGTMLNIGGTADARAVLPRIGFQVRTERVHFTRVLHPWRHWQNSPKHWKSPARLARDYRELSRPVPPIPRAWNVRRVSSFAGLPPEALPDPSVTGDLVCARTPESLDYFLACPAAHMEGYLIESSGRTIGYFLLSRVHHECRIADLWIRAAQEQAWGQAYAAAAAAALSDPFTTTVSAAACAPVEQAALAQAGYRRTHSEPVFVLDPQAQLQSPAWSIRLLENDGFYWTNLTAPRSAP